MLFISLLHFCNCSVFFFVADTLYRLCLLCMPSLVVNMIIIIPIAIGFPRKVLIDSKDTDRFTFKMKQTSADMLLNFNPSVTLLSWKIPGTDPGQLSFLL